ncbi:Clr6 histone deacetylase associated PHD protein-2 Cph2 [Ciborinia camelliae]|nr:Clr6 histone deacetylase associated PHD protein-2 Cph2 [Ciborinia camelliae]
MASKNPFFDPTLSGISAGLESTNEFEQTSVFADSLGLDDDLDPLFPANWDEDTPPYDGGLYSTPLNWDPPMPKPQEDLQNLGPTYTTMNQNGGLTAAQQEKLRHIAMPPHLKYHSQRSPNSSTSKSNSISSPESLDNSRKRKSSAEVDDDDDDESAGQHPPVKKTAHNLIERRYRTNLNEKIAALRDSVPSLRIMQKSARGEDTADDREELQGLTPAHKLNKATVLAKATEYIRHLEKRNSRLQDENTQMKTRINAFEKLFVSGSMGFGPIQQPMNPYQYAQDFNTPGPSPSSDQGMIPVPDDMRRLHGQMSQETFAVPTQYVNQNRQPIGPNAWNGGYFGKLMVGSLAGLMMMQGFSEAEQDADTPGARGLMALPSQFLRTLSRGLHSALEVNFQGYHLPASQTIHYLQCSLALGLLLYVFLPSVFSPKPNSKGSKSANLAAAPSLASSIQVRRQAWLTAIQTVWVPRHNFFLEAAALCMKVGKFTCRNIVGPSLYSFLTGTTEEQEVARIKAWSIALDAQLTGGDVEVSKSRLTLTLLASGTLPDTPARLMLKALHIRVLLWELNKNGFAGSNIVRNCAQELARWKWNEAKQMQQILSQSKEQHDELPEYLATLLEQKCDDVLVDAVIQRAYNLAWNLPTTKNTKVNCGMDRVVDDFAIRSPLDAVAAWWSSLTLHKALAKSLEADNEGVVGSKTVADEINIAIQTAPPGSGAQIRALVARAVLVKEKRGQSIAIALKAVGAGQQKMPVESNVNIKTSIANLPDIQTSIHCAMALAYLERFPMPAHPENATRIIESIAPTNLTLLGFTAMFKLVGKMHEHTLIASTCATSLEKFAGNLRLWIGGTDGEKSGLETELKRDMVEKCLSITAQVVGMENDAGYGSMSDDDDSEGC